MKTLIKFINRKFTHIILIALFLCACAPVMAQSTNAVPDLISQQYGSLAQQVYDDTIGTSNGVFVATGARKLVGNANRFSLDYIYSLTPGATNVGAGLVIGIDDIRAGSLSQANVLKGGVTLNANVYPFKNFGATNFFVTTYAFSLVATPTSGTSNNGGIGQLSGAGASYEQHFTKNLSLELGGFYENATGEGKYNGNYLGVLFGLHYRF
jgi:hypothetical protein